MRGIHGSITNDRFIESKFAQPYSCNGGQLVRVGGGFISSLSNQAICSVENYFVNGQVKRGFGHFRRGRLFAGAFNIRKSHSLVLDFGPQRPAAHAVLRLILEVDRRGLAPSRAAFVSTRQKGTRSLCVHMIYHTADLAC